MPLCPSPASGPEVPGTLYGFVCCAGVLWDEEPPTGASLVGSSHCETPVLIWTSIAVESVCFASFASRGVVEDINRAMMRPRLRTVILSGSVVYVSFVSRGMRCEGGAASVSSIVLERETYELSHCAIQPAGSLGSVGSVGPESGETGGMGGVGTAMSLVWRAGDGGVQRGDAIGRQEEEYKRDSV